MRLLPCSRIYLYSFLCQHIYKMLKTIHQTYPELSETQQSAEREPCAQQEREKDAVENIFTAIQAANYKK